MRCFRRGRRYIALEGSPEFFTLYEADTAETLAGLLIAQDAGNSSYTGLFAGFAIAPEVAAGA